MTRVTASMTMYGYMNILSSCWLTLGCLLYNSTCTFIFHMRPQLLPGSHYSLERIPLGLTIPNDPTKCSPDSSHFLRAINQN
ncbi:hypothetical protein BKA67DRAFT_549983 [Truncatella angustata]|uniref:Uncharacterized protein n=1 Tax=Truncatella angustata TaxID=152316 RepID=A0A9P8UZ30_9PEZI|nr:uncharacterized protein BKA67DRAFT_549983 [Truncatella angustata]KAH6661045.1 hypothetical protein BKA67DRAFT_549983 [Truncatella angustata]